MRYTTNFEFNLPDGDDEMEEASRVGYNENFEKIDTMIDFVVERGTTTTTLSQGGTQTWWYEKWNSGKLAAWAEIGFTEIPCNIAYGSLFRTDSFAEYYPSMFTNQSSSNLCTQITKIAGDAGMLQLGTGRSATTHRLPLIYIVRGTSSATMDFRISVLVIGTWK